MIPGLETIAAGLLYLTAGGGIECKARPLPPVRVVPAKSAVRYDHSKTQAQLDSMDIDTVNPYGNHKQTHVGGLMSGEIRVEHQIGFLQERYDRLNKLCLHYDGIDVNIVINPTIYIAREHPPGSCRHTTILEHEKKHVEVDRIVVNKYAKRIGEAVSFALNKYGATFGPFDTAQLEPVQLRLQTYINDIVDREVKAMNEERMKLQQAVDSLQEYERVRRLCPER